VEKRLVVFIILSLIIIFTYPIFINWVAPPPPVSPGPSVSSPDSSETKTESESPQEVHEKASDILPEKEVMEEPLKGVGEAMIPFNEGQAEEVEKVIESELYRITLSSLGGTIKKWELKQYKKTKEEAEALGEPIQLAYSKGKRLPLQVLFSERAEGIRLYTLDRSPLKLDKNHPEASVKMISLDSSRKKIQKVLTFHYDRYLVDLSLEVEGAPKDYALSLGTNFGIQEWEKQRGKSAGAIALVDTEVFRDSPGEMEEDVKVYQGRAKWIALQDKYFISALIPGEGLELGAITFRKENENEISAQLAVKGGGQVQSFSLYVGPKEYDRLNALKVNLDESIDFGWFIGGSMLLVRLISKPIFYILRFFYQFTHNYGVAIILVTVLIKAFFYPITRKSMQSMKSMSSIQPKINAIKKQWANNKEKMNQEMIKLYKTEKVNPLGGCLPMLIQIPVFISLYNILYTTIELRQAPFFLWVQDLSAKDPYYVLPIIMGATMFIQQYTQPTTMDSAQAKMMLFLPVVYTYFFLNFPSGLVLYWLVNNSLTIAQQYYLGKEGLSAAKIKAGAS